MKKEREREREKKKKKKKSSRHHGRISRSREKLTTHRFVNWHDRTFELGKKIEKELSAAPALLDFSVTVCVTELSERLLLEGGDWRYHHATLRSPTSPFLFRSGSWRRGRPRALLGSVQDPQRDREHPRVGSRIVETRVERLLSSISSNRSDDDFYSVIYNNKNSNEEG